MKARCGVCRCLASLQDLCWLQLAALVRTHAGLPSHESAPNSASGMASSPCNRPRAIRLRNCFLEVVLHHSTSKLSTRVVQLVEPFVQALREPLFRRKNLPSLCGSHSR